MNKNIIAVLGLFLATIVFADNTKLLKQLEKMGATNIKIIDSPIPNFKSAISDQGILQISEDGRFILKGTLLEFKNGKVNNITNKPLMSELESLKDEMIIYPAKNPKYTVTVFTDIGCYYCQKLHSKIKEYNDLGITIRYLGAALFSGINSDKAKQMEAIWQSNNKNYVFNEAKLGNYPKKYLTPKITKKHYNLARRFGLRGTPGIISSEGEVIGGYLEPKQLLNYLRY